MEIRRINNTASFEIADDRLGEGIIGTHYIVGNRGTKAMSLRVVSGESGVIHEESTIGGLHDGGRPDLGVFEMCSRPWARIGKGVMTVVVSPLGDVCRWC